MHKFTGEFSCQFCFLLCLIRIFVFFLEVEFSDSTHSDVTGELGTVSCGSTTSETEAEVMYTTIGAFHAGNLNLEDATRLTSVGVHLPSSLPSNTLCALVTSTGHSLVSPSAELILDTEKKQAADGEAKVSILGNQVPISVHQDQFVTEGLDNNTKMDVTEYVVRCAGDEQDAISHTSQERTEVVGGAVLQGGKLTGGFDVCITSMMNHITSEDGQDSTANSATKGLQPSVMSSGSSKRSRTLDFRDVHPDDHFAPPAVIFQVRSVSNDNLGPRHLRLVFEYNCEIKGDYDSPFSLLPINRSILKIHYTMDSVNLVF